MSNEAPCRVCKGSKDEHFDAEGKAITQHVYSPSGELVTQAEAAAARQAAQKPGPMPGMMAYMGNAGMSVARLTELLILKGILTAEDALYVAGMGQLPKQPSGYQDPAPTFGVDSPGGGI